MESGTTSAAQDVGPPSTPILHATLTRHKAQNDLPSILSEHTRGLIPHRRRRPACRGRRRRAEEFSFRAPSLRQRDAETGFVTVGQLPQESLELGAFDRV
jgi:hypothetical protein